MGRRASSRTTRPGICLPQQIGEGERLTALLMQAMQFINKPFRKMSWIHSLLFHYQDPPLPEHLKDTERDLTIHIVPFPSSFTASGEAVFPAPPAHRKKEMAWQQECNPDLVVLCTGYLQDWSWLGDGYVKGPLQCGIRGVCDEKDLSVAFIGFVRPGVGMYAFDVADLRCDSTHCRNAVPVVGAVESRGYSGTANPRELPPAG